MTEIIGQQSTRRPDLSHVPNGLGLAELLRDGATVDGLATRYGCSVTALRKRITNAGFESGTGQPGVGNYTPRERETPAFDYKPESWLDQAACADMNTDWWFMGDTHRTTVKAIEICNTCPAKAQCLAYALDFEAATDALPEGIYGGLTGGERKALLREQAA